MRYDLDPAPHHGSGQGLAAVEAGEQYQIFIVDNRGTMIL